MRQTPLFTRSTSTTHSPAFVYKCLAETIGTAFLVFAGAGTVAAFSSLQRVAGSYSVADLLAVAIAFTFAIAVMVNVIGHISGCHINPAITIALAVLGRFPWVDAIGYIIAQLVGALVGALLIALAFGMAVGQTTGYGATDYNPVTTGWLVAMVLEAVGTFFLLFTVMSMTEDQRSHKSWAGLMIGATVGAGILVLGAITGGSFNPARTFGPVVIQLMFGGSYNIAHLWVYIIGPIVGAICGVIAYGIVAGLKPIVTPASGRGFEVAHDD